MTLADWSHPGPGLLAAELRMTSETLPYTAPRGAIFPVLDNGSDTTMRRPEPTQGAHWRKRLDSARDRMPDHPAGLTERSAAESVVAFVLSGLAADA